jgi:hypothetical protein
MGFRDFGWVTERTNAWDAIGVISYGLLSAFIESLLVFLVTTLSGFLLPRRWSIDKRIGFLSLLILITSLWAMVSQLLFLGNVGLPAWAIDSLRNSGHPLRILYAACLAVVTGTVLLPVYFFLMAKKSVPIMQNLIERLSLLTTFYLCFDMLGVIIIFVRNL